MLVLRQSPFIPWSVGNYMLGAVTEAPIAALALGTFIGSLPLTSMLAFAGAKGNSIIKSIVDGGASPGTLLAVALVIMLAVASTVLVGSAIVTQIATIA